MDLEIAKISANGQVVIPGKIRKKLGIGAGNHFVVYTNDDSIIFKKLDLPKTTHATQQ